MAVPILWTPGILWVLLQENHHAHKIPRFRWGSLGFGGGGGRSANFGFIGAGGPRHFCASDLLPNETPSNRSQHDRALSLTDAFRAERARHPSNEALLCQSSQ